MDEDLKLGPLFVESAALMARLRAPGGCPWDCEQTHDTIRKYTLEETYEVLDAIERRDWPNLCEELGDLLLQVLFYAEIGREADRFTLEDVLAGLNRKLIRRHPHVFGSSAEASHTVGLPQAMQPDVHQVPANWSDIKAQEKKTKPQLEQRGYLSDVLRAQSALSEAGKLGSAAAKAGFDWPDVSGLLEKVREEAAEIEAEVDASADKQDGRQTRIDEEVGDLLFTVANLARHFRVDAEMALRDANAKFRRRFQAMERASERLLAECSAQELEQAWSAVKAAERQQ